jgi:hypothetical protein
VKAGFVQAGRDNFCYISDFGCRLAESRHTDRVDNWYAGYARGKVSALDGPLTTISTIRVQGDTFGSRSVHRSPIP